MLRFLSICCFIAVSYVSLSAQTGCPGCELMLPDGLPADTIYLSAAADGQVGVPYDEDLSFRMPMTTTPVNANDPDTPPGIGISSMSILGMVGLPVGLQWEVSQSEFNVADQTDGCAKICGTPLLSGLYEVEVVVEANIVIFTQQTSFSFFIMIEPAETITDGFSIDNNAGCGTVATNFTNNIPSNGEDGFTYFWDFGNGNSTTAENPNEQMFTVPGDYEVNYQAIVDTAGFFLTQIVIEQTPCTDLFNNPDLKVDIFDPMGEHAYTTTIIGNANLPISYDLFLPIEEGNYELHVIDDDGGLDGADDLCGVINFNTQSNGALSVGDLMVTINMIHPVDTIRSSGFVHVFPIPATPLLSIVENPPFCEGMPLHLVAANYTEGLHWSVDSLPILTAISDTLVVENSGEYAVFYTSEDGCDSEEAVQQIELIERPAAFILQQEGNLIRIEDESQLPADFSFSWYFEGELIPTAAELVICTEAAGVYALEIIDNATACSTTIEIEGTYDASIHCSTPTVDLDQELSLTVYPNPFYSNLHISNPLAETVCFLMYDGLGRQVLKENINHSELSIDVEHLSAGIYFYKIQLANGVLYQTGSLVK